MLGGTLLPASIVACLLSGGLGTEEVRGSVELGRGAGEGDSAGVAGVAGVGVLRKENDDEMCRPSACVGGVARFAEGVVGLSGLG